MVLVQLFAPALLTALTLPVLILCLIVLKKQSVPAYPAAKHSSFAGPPLLPTWHKGAWLMYIKPWFLLIYCVINEVAFCLDRYGPQIMNGLTHAGKILFIFCHYIFLSPRAVMQVVGLFLNPKSALR